MAADPHTPNADERAQDTDPFRSGLNGRDQRIGALEERLRRRENEIAQLRRDAESLGRRIRQLQSQVKAMERSRSWRITAPLRQAATQIRLRGKHGSSTAGAIIVHALRGGPKAVYRVFRDRRLLLASPTFDAGYYLRHNRDVAAARVDPALHYLLFGAAEGRDPSPAFRSEAYLKANPDVAAAGVNPLVHYLRHGAAEGRVLRPLAENAMLTDPGADGHAAWNLKTVRPANTSWKRIAVFTAIVGGYDALRLPEVVSPDCDYICFTDAPIAEPGIWELCRIDYFNIDAVRIARYVKTHPHVYLSDYEWSIWVDANLLLRGDMSELVSALADGTLIAAFHHPKRQCIYDEADTVVRQKLDDPGLVEDQMSRYKKKGYPPHIGLSETNVLVRRHNHPDVVDLDTDWWREIENGSRRDQLSLNFVAWNRGLVVSGLAPHGVSVRNDERFAKFRHGAGAGAPAMASGGAPDSSPSVSSAERARYRREAFSHLKTDIIVCVHDSLEDVRRCLESVQRCRPARQRLVVVDDGSSVGTRKYLEEFFGDKPGDLLIRHAQALGYTKAANAGLRASTGDYAVLLNSDTIVSDGWIEKVLECGESSADIGIVGPMSNAASWQSIPEIVDGKGNPAISALLSGVTVDQMNAMCEEWSSGVFPRVPLVNGFCFAVKRSVIDKIGHLDEEAFPQGYGEENDYCFRAVDAGFIGAIATHTYVFHAKSKSFTHERRRILSKQGRAAFRARYPASRINNAVLSMRSNPELARIRAMMRRWATHRAISAERDRGGGAMLKVPAVGGA